MRTKLLSLVLILAGTLFIFGRSGFAASVYDPCVINVKAGESIQSAVNLAETNAAGGAQCSIWIGEGIFTEDITIGNNQPNLKNLIISGAAMDKTVIRGRILVHFFQTSGIPIDGGVTTVKNLTLDGQSGASYGLIVVDDYVRAESLHVTGYRWGGIYGQINARLEVSRSIIEHSNNGVLTNSVMAKMFLLNNTIAYNSTAGAAILYSGTAFPLLTARFVNNIFYQNGFGIHGNERMQIYMGYNAFFLNYVDFDVTPIGDPNIFGVDPEFAFGGYQLKRTSPMRNAGDPASPYDPDGTRSDIGAFSLSYLPTLIGAVSVKIHATTSHDLAIPLDEGLFVEPRRGGVEKVVLTFDENVDDSNVTVTSSKGTAASSVENNQITVSMSGLANGQSFALTIDGIANDNRTLPLGNLYGDAAQSGLVDVSDVTLAASLYRHPVNDALAIRSDVDLSNSIAVQDLMAITRNRGSKLNS